MSLELDAFLKLLTDHDEGEPAPELRDASGVFLQRAAAGDDTLLHGVNRALGDLPPAGASWVAILYGAQVERGGDPGRTAAPVMSLLRDWITLLPDLESEEEEEEEEGDLNSLQQEGQERRRSVDVRARQYGTWTCEGLELSASDSPDSLNACLSAKGNPVDQTHSTAR